MKRFFISLPVFFLLADMAYGFILNIMQSLGPGRGPLSRNGLSLTPDIAFNGLQALANGMMFIILGYGLLTLLGLYRSLNRPGPFTIGVFRALGLLAVLAFGLPSLWHWGWALAGLAEGRGTVSADTPRYLIAALCQPWAALLCLICLYKRHRRTAPSVSP